MIMKQIILIFAFFCVVSLSSAQTSTTIYTKGGQAVEVLILDEYSQSKLNQLLASAIINYPNAIVVDGPSHTYNCHFYAWCKTDTLVSGNYWLNYTNSYGYANVSKFWTNDCYGETTEPNAEKIFYYAGDHSAVVSPTTSSMYISKWGSGPLMMHAPGYGPYEYMMNYRKYYYNSYNPARPYPIVTYGLISCSNGNGVIGVGVSADYETPMHTSSSITMECSIETAKGDDAVDLGRAVINNTLRGGYNVTFNTQGIYEMSIRFYNKSNQLIAEYTFEPIVEI